jgi:hypothetical protein
LRLASGCEFVMPQERAQRLRGHHEVGSLLRTDSRQVADARAEQAIGERLNVPF